MREIVRVMYRRKHSALALLLFSMVFREQSTLKRNCSPVVFFSLSLFQTKYFRIHVLYSAFILFICFIYFLFLAKHCLLTYVYIAGNIKISFAVVKVDNIYSLFKENRLLYTVMNIYLSFKGQHELSNI